MCTFEEHGGDRRFLAKLTEIATTHSEKQHDYGAGDDPFANLRASKDFGVEPWVGTVIRMNDKVTRIKSFIAKGTLKNEPIADSFRDIAVYALIAWILYEETIAEEILALAKETLRKREPEYDEEETLRQAEEARIRDSAEQYENTHREMPRGRHAS